MPQHAKHIPDMLDDTTVNCGKTVEPIEMPFGFWIRVGPINV